MLLACKTKEERKKSYRVYSAFILGIKWLIQITFLFNLHSAEKTKITSSSEFIGTNRDGCFRNNCFITINVQTSVETFFLLVNFRNHFLCGLDHVLLSFMLFIQFQIVKRTCITFVARKSHGFLFFFVIVEKNYAKKKNERIVSPVSFWFFFSVSFFVR